uniref:Uncharacterized protein n=1 Tax=Magnetococcus massalia (strain MO-1) TaxID=451514 RepID=A0A1S7LGQ2_MAGMO|nr:protein of unknown function [Candidatus Magnetococcus massalia]
MQPIVASSGGDMLVTLRSNYPSLWPEFLAKNWPDLGRGGGGVKSTGYDKPVDPALIQAFGEPAVVPWTQRVTSTDPERTLLKKPNYSSYPYAESVKGMLAYAAQPQHARIGEKKRPKTVRKLVKTLPQVLGMYQVPIGNLKKHTQHPVVVPKDASYSVSRHTWRYGSGAVGQALLAKPKDQLPGPRKGLIVALHGCSSSPDKLLGMGAEDYAHRYAQKAVQAGWWVLVPFHLNYCQWLNDYDRMLALGSGTTAMGYELMVIRRMVQWLVINRGPFAPRHVWGISKGGRLAMTLAAMDGGYHTIVVSGNMVYDETTPVKTPLDDFRKLRLRGDGRLEEMWRRIGSENMIKAILPRRVILEMGAYEKYLEDQVGTIQRLQSYVKRNYPKKDPLTVRFFKGYHETDGAKILELLAQGP